MCLDNLSGCNLIGVSSSLAITLGQNMTADELGTIAAFLTSLADNFAILSIQKAKEESNSNSPCF